MPTPQRLPYVNGDDGQWGDILVQWLKKEHYDDATDNAVNGGHQKVTLRAGSATAGTAPLKFTSGTLLSTPEAGAIEFLTDKLYFTGTTGPTRRTIAAYDDSSGATGDIYYRDSSGIFTRLGIGSNTNVLTVSSGLPAWSAAASGTVTTVSVVSANGLAGSVANATTTPAITLSTSVTGVLKGNGTAISAATAGTDYINPAGVSGGQSITGGTGSSDTLSLEGTSNAITSGSVDITGGSLKLFPNNPTITTSGIQSLVSIFPDGATLDYTTPLQNMLVHSSTISLNQNSHAFLLGTFASSAGTWKNVSGVTASFAGYIAYSTSYKIQADGATLSTSNHVDFSASPTLNTAATASSVLTVTSQTNFVANLTVNATTGNSTTVTTRTGLRINDATLTGAGTKTLTTQIGIDVAALNAAGTTNIGVRVDKANTYSLQLSDAGGTAAGGITFGTDTNLYRSNPNELTTDDALVTGAAITAGGKLSLFAGTTSNAPLAFTSGTNLTTPVAGAQEYDGAQFYGTIDTTSGRGAIPAEQYFRLSADGSTISTIANFFGANSNISLVANAYYEIEIFCWFLNTTAGTVTWTFTNSAAPTNQNIHYRYSPVGGVNTGAGAATYLEGDIVKDNTAALALTVSGTLTTAVDHYAHFKFHLRNGTGTSLKIQATKGVGGTITPRAGSYYKARRLPASSTGTFAA